jgi:hypothetical protein
VGNAERDVQLTRRFHQVSGFFQIQAQRLLARWGALVEWTDE